MSNPARMFFRISAQRPTATPRNHKSAALDGKGDGLDRFDRSPASASRRIGWPLRGVLGRGIRAHRGW
jgi:hypothetical protein